jgi:hypothetical protein
MYGTLHKFLQFQMPPLYVNVKLSVSLTNHHAMKTYWGSGGIASRILDLGTRWRWVVSFTPRPLTPRERAPGTNWIGGWVGPRAVLDAEVKRKITSPRRKCYVVLDYNCPLAWGSVEELTTSHRKIPASYEMIHRTSKLANSCEHGNGPLSPVKRGQFLDWLSDC